MLKLLPHYIRFKHILLDPPHDLARHEQFVQQLIAHRQLWSNPAKTLALTSSSQTSSVVAVRSMSPISQVEMRRRFHQLLECLAVDWRWPSNNSLYAPFCHLYIT
uniref:Uncharacterized protein n=1 Tax=Ditylenchus dipsaci TaxID=166011 RepID=A0A915DMY5_9BILA